MQERVEIFSADNVICFPEEKYKKNEQRITGSI